MITQQQYNELKAERDALAAQAKALKDLAEFWINRAKPYQPSEREYKTWLALGYGSNAMRSTPQQHLAEIRAEAGRVGFIAGYHKMHIEFVGSLAPSGSAEIVADQYAAKVRQGAE
jgi:hypothetical protein